MEIIKKYNIMIAKVSNITSKFNKDVEHKNVIVVNTKTPLAVNARMVFQESGGGRYLVCLSGVVKTAEDGTVFYGDLADPSGNFVFIKGHVGPKGSKAVLYIPQTGEAMNEFRTIPPAFLGR